ncbi:hypothetical protein DEI99_013515 [Curtobacterium sp. MCLR17_036]|uniref:hypothetical protein n=1 Tax=Curtobacterium sp. MCLR17_036 TaxID=2175620 RepID=UPI0011B63F0C|nr:hypothetical protein [Curtobacterium sp. MCLR17_036]WIE64242.1 hypothetical protein DEI99_013515 [Curtobacterium sp. MCLR17_036]
MSTREQQVGPATTEAFADRLQRLRHTAGDPSYGDIAARITARRLAAGTQEGAARIARSTVYDVFRPGRTRLNAVLVGEVVRVLGVADGDVEAWERAARSPVVAADGAAPATWTAGPTVGSAPAARPETDERPIGRPGAAPRTGSVPTAVASVRRWWPTGAGHRPDAGSLALLVAAAVGIDLFGASVSGQFHLPIWLDTIGTAVVALRLGPWIGAGVGAGAVLLNQLAHGPTSFWFALVGAVAGVLWGVGVRQWSLQRSPWRLLVLGLVVAVGCTAVATPVTVLAYQATVTHGTQAYIDVLSAAGDGPWAAVALANLGASVVDKVLTTFAAFGLLVLLERRSATSTGAPLTD